MTLTKYDWKENGEDDKGYFFVLSDTMHHLDYNVILIKDNGEVTVNGNYINTVSPELAAAINPRIDFFMAMNKIKDRHSDSKSESDKKEEKKTDKKDNKKSDSKKSDKKDKK